MFNRDVPPQNVEVVSGDGFDSELGNTISWTYDPAATGHVVYWDTQRNVTVNSPQVDPCNTCYDYVTHSGPDVIPGTTYYYLVVATAGDEVSVPSEEVSGTPQLAITDTNLNDVAWNGYVTDGSMVTLVAVGDSGVIQYSQNGTEYGWTAVNHGLTVESLAAVTWGNDQYLVVGAGGTVLTSLDGMAWETQESKVKTDLEDVAWTGTEYIVVGKNGAILTGNADGTVWTEQTSGVDTAITLEGVAVGNGVIVAAGTKGTVITSENAGVDWNLIDLSAQGIYTGNDLNDVTWDGTNFGVVGSNSTILSSPDGLDWTEHYPAIGDYALIGATQWDSGLPADPNLTTVGSSGTFIVSLDNENLDIVRTGTNEQLSAVTWVDDGASEPYFVIVGHDGTVLTLSLIHI